MVGSQLPVSVWLKLFHHALAAAESPSLLPKAAPPDSTPIFELSHYFSYLVVMS